MIRAFVAIEVPQAIRQRLDELGKVLRRLELDARFVNSGSIHLTLKFLGDVEESAVQAISGAIVRATEGIQPFSVAVSKLGVFPTLRNPRVLWVGIAGSAELLPLQSRMDAEMGRLGYQQERRPFSPHLTLARIESSRNVEKLARYVELEGPGVELGEFRVQGVHLFRSILRPEGAEYRILATAPLEPISNPGLG